MQLTMTSIQKYLLLFLTVFIFCSSSGQETQVQYLSGTGNDNTVNWQFYCSAGRNSGKWTTIPVPSNWELQGFGKYDYGFAKDSVRGKETGLYKYEFSVPAGWKGKAVNIVFEGSMTDTEVKINGKSAGPIQQGAFYAFKYDISKLLNYGASNTLEASVAKHSANNSVNAAERRADFWIFGGIFRPVFLEALPPRNIARVALDASAKGEFKANVYLSGKTSAGEMLAQIYTLDGKRAGAPIITKISIGDTLAVVETKIPSPRLWSSEFPNLYRVVFTLSVNGKPLHTVSQKFGFRTVEVKERDGVYVNGVKIKFKGVCRHSFWPSSGRALSKAISIGDVLMMKDMNMNAVRMSHYPPDGHFLDACDSLGLFVMDELAGWHGMYDTETGSKLLKEMIDHDVNHPSIVFWNNGNEGGHNLELDPLFYQYDIQRRPVTHPWQFYSGIETDHYREYDYGIGNYMHGRNIVMPTEFLHGMYDGGHGAGLEDYWETMWRYPLSAGGFLWDFADEGIVRTDKNGEIDTDGNRGADGIVGPYHEKEGSYNAIKEIWSPVYFERKEITSAFDGKLNIENRYHFANINQCSFTWSLKSFRQASISELKGSVASPDIKPLEKGSLHLLLPKNWNEYDVLYVTANGVDKKEIFTWSFPITRPATIVKALFPVKNGKVELNEIDSAYDVTANGIHVRINKQNGMLLQVQNDKGNIPFNNGPVLQEGVNNFRNFTHRFISDTLFIRSTFERKNSYNTLQWTVYPSGLIKMQVNYFPAEYFTSMVGVNFSFPESEMRGVEYLGNGPYRVWKNRMKGNKFGIWNKSYNNTETGEAPFVYPEFKGYHSNMYWCKFKTTGQPFTVMTTNEDLFFRLFTPAFKTDQWHNYEPTFPGGDISFMQGISSIGSKTQRNETTGPMGMKNIFYDYEKDPARCLVMTLYFDFSAK